ncbi:wsv099 [White spot syndrome virus]|uniref:Wsv099 n=5 Tax=White spot syndrome virus TaxID=342409 RepID=Q8VB84_WSSVS|nr:wsv099 [Shrimp white spot syndrome virus]AFX59476.1 wsv099 [White spot syndrome virus]AAL33103.1 wsv099 [Shrimp white spot syndrome virus]AAL89023.1 WSSV155 [Shrimp white spot syndrome virus]AWQ60287.1 wsv099 [Shrimp white spot syndrome virus]AWQ60702.1 wsv099 [Shrimp white spot syndrome virus]
MMDRGVGSGVVVEGGGKGAVEVDGMLSESPNISKFDPKHSSSPLLSSSSLSLKDTVSMYEKMGGRFETSCLTSFSSSSSSSSSSSHKDDGEVVEDIDGGGVG